MANTSFSVNKFLVGNASQRILSKISGACGDGLVGKACACYHIGMRRVRARALECAVSKGILELLFIGNTAERVLDAELRCRTPW